MRRVVRALGWILLACCVGCSSIEGRAKVLLDEQVEVARGLPGPLWSYYPRAFEARRTSNNVNHVWAIYDNTEHLINRPLDELAQVLAAEAAAQRPVTDIYVVSHGWNFTVEEALANYGRYVPVFTEKVKLMRASAGREFNPAFVFVARSSVSRPIQAAAASVLPYDLDESISWITQIADAPFHLLSNWRESNRAYLTALGTSQERHEPTADNRISVADLVQTLARERDSRKLHLVGHSHGAKLLTLAAILAGLRAHGADPLIDSLVLFNPAFNPAELEYVDATVPLISGGMARLPIFIEEHDVIRALQRVQRKAVVYSNHDQATGWVFGMSQVLLNNWQVQSVNDLFDDPQFDHPLMWPVVLGAKVVQVAYNIGTSVGQWVYQKGVNLPFDYWHHLTQNDTVGEGTWYSYPFNAVHFFVPLDTIWPGGQDSDELGLFRPAFPALGRSGLDALGAGRPWQASQVFALREFIDPEGSTRIDADDFLAMALHPHLIRPAQLAEYDDPNRFYSFDASSVFDGAVPTVGSHGDLRKESVVARYALGDDAVLDVRNIDCTVNFLFNFSQPHR